MAAWFQDFPLDWSRPETRKAHEALVLGAGSVAELELLAAFVGIDWTHVNAGQPPRLVGRDLMVLARKSGKLVRLFYQLIQNAPAVADLFAIDAAALTAEVLKEQSAKAMLASFPSSVEAWPAGEPKQPFEKVVNKTAGFADPAVFRQHLVDAELRTCRIEMNGHAEGSGFLVGPDLILTCWHVVAGGGQGVARFDHKVAPSGMLVSEGRAVPFAANWLVKHSNHEPAPVELSPDGPPPGTFDFALVRLSAPVGSEPIGANPVANGDLRGFYTLDGGAYSFRLDEPILIVGHPKGRPTQLSYASPANVVLTKHKNRVRYGTNTDGGSSGSPVFNKDWRIVALHHAGGETNNQGIPISLIVPQLE